MADGTLPVAAFRNFLIQDYPCLFQYVRASALAVYKAGGVAGMCTVVMVLSGLLDTGLSMHVNYCQEWGIDKIYAVTSRCFTGIASI